MLSLSASDTPRPRRVEPGPDASYRVPPLERLETALGPLVIALETGAFGVLDADEDALLTALARAPRPLDGALAAEAELTPDRARAALEALLGARLVLLEGAPSARPELDSMIARQSRRVFSLVMVLSSGCNLACKYCYLGHESPRAWVELPTERALEAVAFALDRGAERTVVDLGEVTVVGARWREIARRARALGEARGRPLELLIQTNGTTLDDEDVALLASLGMSVGVSLDGPEALHDRARPYRSGRGTHARVVEALSRLRARGVPHWTITTVARHNVDAPEAIMDHLEALGVAAFAFKPVLPFGEAGEVWEELGIGPEAYGRFMERAIRRGLEGAPPRLDLGTKQFLLRALGSPRGWVKSCTSRSCGCGESRLVIEADGRATPCPRFGDYGAPWTSGAAPALVIPRWARSQPRRCESCAYQVACGGGCALSGVDDPHCASYQAIFGAIFREVVPRLIRDPEAARSLVG